MREKVTQIKRAISVMLAAIMVVSCLPQTAYTVYAAEDIAIDSEVIEETVSEVVPEEVVSEEMAAEESIQEEILSDEEISEIEVIALEGEELQTEETQVMDETQDLQNDTSAAVTFKVTGGKMPKLDPNAIEYEGNETDGYTSQSFRYFERDGMIFAGVSHWSNIEPVCDKEGYYFYDWLSQDDGLWYPYQIGFADKETNRTYVAEFRTYLGDAPEIDESYGSYDGVKLYNDQTVTPHEDGVCFSIKVKKESYPNIAIGENQALRIYYTYGAKTPVHRNDGTGGPDSDGFYSVWNTQIVEDISKDTILPVEFKGSDYLFDSNPTKAVDLHFSLKFVLVEKDSEGKSYLDGVKSNLLGESAYKHIYCKYTPFVTSTSLKNKAVLSPAIGGAAVTSAINVNAGANAKNLDIIYVSDFGEKMEKPEYVDVNLTDGKLTVKVLPEWKWDLDSEGKAKPVKFVFYDTSNDTDWDRQLIGLSDRAYTITPTTTWASKTPSASLVSATDVALNFKVTAPSGIKFDENYYVAINLVPTTKTRLPEGYTITDKTTYAQINNDGTIPEVSVYPFWEGGYDVKELGRGLGTSMTAKVRIVRAASDPGMGGEILAETQSKSLTVSTKTPYYADKITLKKGVTSFYADGETEQIVATVDFGKNTTYTRAEDWEIENIESLALAGITATQEGNNKIKVKVESETKAGTYTIAVATKADAAFGVPARASINIKVLPTAEGIFVSPINVYHKLGKAVNYTIDVKVKSQDGAIIKNPTLTYEIGKKDDTEIDNPVIVSVKGLSISKGKIKIDKTFKTEESAEYVIKVKTKCGREVTTNFERVNIVEESIKLAEFKFPGIGNKIVNNTDFTLKDYLALGWNQEYLEENKDKEFFDADDLYDAEGHEFSGVMIEDADGNIVNSDLLKSVKIPNPACVKKTGKLTFTATAIDGTKLTKTINIIPDTGIEFDSGIYVSGQYKMYASEDNPFKIEQGDTLDASGVSTGVTYSVWLAKPDELIINTKNGYISGDTLTVKGGKIVENIHNDYIKFVMTGRTATITRKRGKATVGTYKITNNSFDLKAPKVTAEKKKIYTGYGDDTQDIVYTFNKAFEDAADLEIKSSNSAFNKYFDKYDFTLEDSRTVRFNIEPDNVNNLKAGSYPFTIELLDVDGNSLCKPAKATLKVEKFKKSFKFQAKYTMSNQDKTYFKLEASGTNYDHIPYEVQVKLFNANTKGKYNNITDILEVYWDDTHGLGTSIKIKEDAELPNAKSITGYIGYTVNFKDGSSEYRVEKITINIAKQALKYKTENTTVEIAEVKDKITGHVMANNQEIQIAKAKVLDSKSQAFVTDSDLAIVDGQLKINLNTAKVTKPGTYTIKVNVIPETSIYKDYNVTKDNSISVTFKIKVTK